MKKIFILISALCIFLSFSGCSKQAAKQNANLEAKALNNVFDDALLSKEHMRENLKLFLNITEEYENGNTGVREAFSEKEKKSAEFLYNYAYSLNSETTTNYYVNYQYFSVGEKYSQNVVVRFGTNAVGLRSQVVICANYDSYVNSSGLTGTQAQDITHSVGAMENGTGVAALMSLMEYFKDKTLGFDIVFLFAGAGTTYNSGASHYVSEMSAGEKEKTLLVYSLRRFGGDNVYLYSEEVKTIHNTYLLDIAAQNNLGIEKTPKNLPVIDAHALDRIPYATFPMTGMHAPFMNEKINVANIFSGNLKTFSIADVESKSVPVISYTQNDIFTNLERDFPQYSAQMSSAAHLIAASIYDDYFFSTMINSRNNMLNYDAFTNETVAYFIVIGLVLILLVVIILFSRKFEKKYPMLPPKILNLKIAVFGSEYEDKNSDNIFIDIKKPPSPFD